MENRLIIIGYTATTANDYFFTPYSGVLEGDVSMPGVMIHAQSASQLISAVLDGRSLIRYWPEGGEMAWILVWAIAGGIPGIYTRKIWQFVLAEGVLWGTLTATSYGLFGMGIWVPLPPALLASAIAAMGTLLLDRAQRTGYSQAFYEQTRSKLKGVFAPDIAVDQSKRDQQVAEITNTTFFKELQQRAREIREQRDQRSSKP